MKKKKMILVVLVGLPIAYLSIGYLFHKVIFPEKFPEISTYFQEGDIMRSDWEGFTQKVAKQENGFVYCSVTLDPHAVGPPKHIHYDFDEYFESVEQEFSLIVGDDTIIMKPGDSHQIPKGTPHKPFNHTDSVVKIGIKTFAFPEEFAFFLNQVYGYFDEAEENQHPPKVLFQMALFNQYFDSHVVENAPPLPIQNFTSFMIIPLARLLGYKSYYEKYDPKR